MNRRGSRRRHINKKKEKKLFKGKKIGEEEWKRHLKELLEVEREESERSEEEVGKRR